MKKFWSLILVFTVLFSVASCGSVKDNETPKETETQSISENISAESGEVSGDKSTEGSAEESETASYTSSLPSDEDMFTKGDLKTEYDGEKAEKITLSGSEDITITEENTYILSGSLDGACLVIDADKSAKIRLVFDGVSIENSGSAALYVKQADKVFITLAEGSENTLASYGEFVQTDDNNIDGAIFSKDDLTLGGTGSLNIVCENGNGIVSKDDLVITGGKYVIDAASHGLEGKDSVRISDGNFTINAGKDGMHSENDDDASLGYVYIENGDFVIDCDGDGISSSLEIKINGGSFDITSGDRSSVKKNDYSFGGMFGGMWGASSSQNADDSISMKALKAEESLTVNGGIFKLDSADDALHSNGSVTVNDGTFTILTGDDGVHADLSVVINGGKISVEESYEGIEGETIDINGGEIDIVSSDDGLNAAGGTDSSGTGGFFGKGGRPDVFGGSSDACIRISGGIIRIDADGDGVDSNGRIEVSGGETYVNGPENSGNGAIDYELEATISGGIFIAAGASGMAQNFSSSSTQGSVMMSCSGKETVSLKTAYGEEIISFTPQKSCNCIVISCPELTVGESYIFECGGSSSEFTLTSLIYGSSGGMGGMDGMGGKPGGR